MRRISSFTLVGELLPPMNWNPLVGLGKIPAARSDVAFGSIKQDGITFPGKGLPGATGETPPGQFAPQPATPVGATMEIELPFASVVGRTAPVPGPFASGYELASGTVWFRVWP